MAPVTLNEDVLGDQPVAWLQAAGRADRAPVLYVHGVPTHSFEWTPFLERTGGVAPDLPGFGRSGKRGDQDFSPEGMADFIERFLEQRGIDRFRLVVHDFGVVGLMAALRAPQRLERLVVVNARPLLPGYRWHRIARAWRTPGVGEVAVGLVVDRTLKWSIRRANVRPIPPAWRKEVIEHFDVGTQRAILALYRSADLGRLAQLGRDLSRIEAPSLVVWGDRDPYVPARFADGYTAALGDAELLHLPEAGHWPWLDDPSLVDRICSFLDA